MTQTVCRVLESLVALRSLAAAREGTGWENIRDPEYNCIQHALSCVVCSRPMELVYTPRTRPWQATGRHEVDGRSPPVPVASPPAVVGLS